MKQIVCQTCALFGTVSYTYVNNWFNSWNESRSSNYHKWRTKNRRITNGESGM